MQLKNSGGRNRTGTHHNKGFHKHKNKLYSDMPFKDPEKRREYNRIYQRGWYRKNRKRHQLSVNKVRQKRAQRFRDFKATLSCIRCGESHPACIVFHHRDPKKKEFHVNATTIWKGVPMKRILAEIEKCDVLCANCHRKLHWEERKGNGPGL